MKRLSRHTVVVLIVALLSCTAGLSLAVVAFGQSTTNPDANVPTGDFTGTTPPVTSAYTSTVPTVTSTYTATTPTTTSQGTTTPAASKPVSANGNKAVPSHGSSPGPVPSRVTRPGPTHLAFTGGEPLIIGGAGLVLMLGGLSLQLRRRRQAPGL